MTTSSIQFDDLIENASVSKQKRFNALLPKIEQALQGGVKHEEILARMNEGGFNLTITTFRNMLMRARRRQKQMEQPGNRRIETARESNVDTLTLSASEARPSEYKASPNEQTYATVTKPVTPPSPLGLPRQKQVAKKIDHDLTKIPAW